MYTGARESEITQLTTQDIKKDENDILYIDINIGNSKSIKNFPSIRKVPVHKDLKEDLLNYIAVKSNKLFSIKSANFAKQFSDFKTKLKYPKTVLVFHSFRHTLQDKLKQKNIQNMMINELTGHSQGKEASRTDLYTNKYQLDLLKDAIDKIDYDISI
jgi:integrase